MDDALKFYGLCIQRLNYQINNAKQNLRRLPLEKADAFLLESYNTSDIEDIIDILELYDIENRTLDSLTEKLSELSFTVSVLTREKLFFGYTAAGHLGLFWSAAMPASTVCAQSEPLNLAAA